MNDEHLSFDDLIPPSIAEKAEAIGTRKANMSFLSMFLLAGLAGAFIALGGNFYTIVVTGAESVPWGIKKTLGGIAFSLGLVLVVIGGAELFTGNNLIAMSVASRRISIRTLLRNWLIVYAGNFAGALATVVLILASRQYTFNDGLVGATAVNIAQHKCNLGFMQAFFLAIYCNALVCLAVWLSMGARMIPGKVLSIVFPITAFIAGGFEHCVANMYLIPLGLMIAEIGPGGSEPLAAAINSAQQLGWGRFIINNLVPVTLGNIVGGTFLVGAIYWLIYRLPVMQKKSAGD